MDSTTLINDLYNSRNNVLNIMKTNGYNTNDYSKFSIQELNAMHQNNQLDMLLEREKENNINKIYIRYFINKSISKKNIYEMIDDLFILEEFLSIQDCLFIIVKDDPNESIINELKNIYEKDGYFITLINIKRLLTNILNHSMVPPHKIMNKVEKENMMIKYNLTGTANLPEISRFDPVSILILMRPGDVCEITRHSKASISSKYYRVCI